MTKLDVFSRPISRRGALIVLATPVASAAGGAWWWAREDAGQRASDAVQIVPDADVTTSAPSSVIPSRGEVRREARRRATARLDWADKESQRLIEECLRPLTGFFDRAKEGLPAFAEVALGWRSKWYALADYVPMTSGNRLRAFLEAKWNEHLFTNAKLCETLKRVTKQYAGRVDDVEQQMLVRLRLDVADLPREVLPELADEKKLAEGFSAAIETAVERARADVGHEIGLFLVAEIAERVLVMVVSRLGLSATVLGTGAAASPYTAGLSLLGALVINYLLDLVWDWYADPQGELVKELGSHLDRLKRLIVEGDGDALGLRGELEAYARRRGRLRAEALAALLDPEK